MELKTEEFEKSLNSFLTNHSQMTKDIEDDLALMYARCRKRVERHQMVTTPLAQDVADVAANFYSFVKSNFLDPYDCKVRSLEILSNMTFNKFITSGITLDSTMFSRFTQTIMKEIHYRTVSNSEKLDIHKLIQDFEDYLFNQTIYQVANANVILFSQIWDNELYTNEPLLQTAHTLLKDLSEQQISNNTKYQETQTKLKILLSNLGNGFLPFDNFSLAINKLYNALSTLHTTSLNKQDFLTTIADNYSSEEKIKIELRLEYKRLSTRQIGFLFFNLRERFSTNYEKQEFRKWFQNNFIICKKNSEILDISDDKRASDLLAQNSLLLEMTPKYQAIQKLIYD